MTNEEILVKHEEILDRARSLVPALRSRAQQAIDERCVPAETIADFKESNLIRIAQPKRFGGFEFDWEVHCQVSEILSEADGGQAWIQGIMANHAQMIATFPLEAQEDVWADDPDTRVSASFDPNGRARRTQGGFIFSGQHRFASGIDHADWLICGGMIEGPAGLSGPHFFLVGKMEVEIQDDWYTLGLEATGSKSFRVQDVFIPEHRFLDGEKARVGEGPGTLVNKSIVYRTPRGGVTSTGFAAMCVGMASSVLQEWLALATPRRKRSSGPWAQSGNLMVAAEAAVQIDAGRELYLATIRHAQDRLRAGDRLDELDLLVARRNVAYACKLAQQAGERLFHTGGAHAIFNNQRLAQQYRNLMAASAHFAVAWEMHAPAYANEIFERSATAAIRRSGVAL